MQTLIGCIGSIGMVWGSITLCWPMVAAAFDRLLAAAWWFVQAVDGEAATEGDIGVSATCQGVNDVHGRDGSR